MRLGILGPSSGDLVGLACAAQRLLDVAQVDAIVYLGDDQAFDDVVVGWAQEVVDAKPAEDALFTRATVRCLRAKPAEIDAYVAGERARRRLSALRSLGPAGAPCLELLDSRRALLVYDPSTLAAEQLEGAAFIVYGSAPEPVVRTLGGRLFVAPGPIGSPSGGSAVLDDEQGGLRVEVFDDAGDVTLQGFAAGAAAVAEQPGRA